MHSATARVPTTNGSKYVQQLCKHWSHKLEVELSPDSGVVKFPEAVATMAAGADILTVTVAADRAEEVERMKDVVAKHLDQFAFREAPLKFEWADAAS